MPNENIGNQLTDMERLAVGQALYKKLGEAVGTKDQFNLRGNQDAYVKALYDQTGAKSLDVRVLGEKVGTYSVRVKEATQEKVLSVSDAAALRSWALQYGFIVPDMGAIQDYFDNTGEVPDGMEVETIEVEGKVTTSLRIDPDKVAGAIGPMLGSAVAGFLGGE